MSTKRLIAFLLAAVMLLSFAACGGEGDSSVADSSAEEVSSASGELSEESGEDSSSAEGGDSSQAESSDGASEGASSEEDSSVAESQPEEDSSVAESQPEEDSSVAESQPEEDSSVAESQPEEDSSIAESQPEEDSSVAESQPEEDSSVAESQPEEDSSVAESQPEEDSSTVIVGDGPLNYDNMKGIWLYQYTTSTSLFKNGSSQRSESSYRELVQRIINNLTRDGFNTVFLQMRPYGDALYPSEIYPPSPFATSGSRHNGTFSYDPLEVFIEIAHKGGISVQAWLNPMRLMTDSEIAHVSTDFKIGQWYNDSSKKGTYIVKSGNRWYLNPAYPETRQLVIDGAVEICKNYDIDGIHFDDYFYISIEDKATDLAFDQAAFNQYGSSYGSASDLNVRKEWRRNNVSTLVKDIWTAVHDYDKDLLFGISPAGNIDNNQTGYLCADIKLWCSTPGYIDYIAPQVYWSMDYSWDPAKFDVCVRSWIRLCTSDSVKLVIGMATYKALNNASNDSKDPGWYVRKTNIADQLDYIQRLKQVSGFIFFKYESTYNIFSDGYNSGCSEEIGNYIGLIKEW